MEVLKYVTQLEGLKLKIDGSGVAVVPITVCTDQLLTKGYNVPPGFIAPAPDGEKSSGNKLPSAKEFLEANGIQFPAGASANFLPSVNKLIVRNTQDNLDLVDALTEASGSAVPPPRTAGLLPMKLDLPLTGEPLVFQGFVAPTQVSFNYLNWRTQARRGWLWAVAGATAFFSMARKRPWRRMLWGVLILSFFPLCLWPSALGACNGLLAGWLLAFVIREIARWSARAGGKAVAV
jgi:hypothetical protein